VLRPEALRVTARAADDLTDALPGVIRDVAFRGTGFSYLIDLPDLGMQVKAETRASASPHLVDAAVGVGWEADACWLLPRDDTGAGARASENPAPSSLDQESSPATPA
jgi:hypothetical protein